MAQRTTPPDLPGFRFIEWLGGGGFADVFRYEDSLGRRVAVKVQHRGVDRGGSSAFEAEGNLMAKLSNHPNVVSIFQAGVAADGRPFLVMEECSTSHLGGRIAQRPLTVSKAMEVTVQVAGAVETAHRMGILHRDIKPANILFTEFQRPALTDFGISATTDQRTANNALSPLWAPWEQYPDSGLAMGPWSDVFSLAATMWAMLAGRSPLAADGDSDRLSIRRRIPTFAAPRTGRHDVPEILERVLATALAADPQQRYQSALEFARAIQGVQGQLNESVTPIDVLSDSEDFAADAPELAETGTRISGFMLIDPDGGDVDHTATTTGPTGGVTSPEGDTYGQAGASDVLATHVIQHGRGFAQPGIRDFTGPAVPEIADHTVMDAPAARRPEAADPEPQRRSMVGILVGIGAVILASAVLLGLWFTGALGGVSTATEPSAGGTASVAPKDPTSQRVPPVEDLAGTLADDQVTFTWTNPDPRSGDKYLVEELSTPTQVPQQVVEETTITVPAQSGQTCIDVWLVRSGGGATNSPTRGCVAS